MLEKPLTRNRTSKPRVPAVALGRHRWLTGCQGLLWLALPLTLAVGCASGPRRPVKFSNVPAPAVRPLSEGQTADWSVAHEIYEMFLADREYQYPLRASVYNGVVTLHGTSFDGHERQRLVDEIWDLEGVNQVKNRHGVDVQPTPGPGDAAR